MPQVAPPSAERETSTALKPPGARKPVAEKASALAAYALAMTVGRGSFGPLNVALLLTSVFGAGLFVLAEARAPSPLIRLAMFGNPVLRNRAGTCVGEIRARSLAPSPK